MKHATSIILAIATLLCCGAVCDPSTLDNGWRVSGGVTLQPGIVPKGIIGDESLEDYDLGHIVEEAATWWEEQSGLDLFFIDPAAPTVIVEINYVEEDLIDWTEINFSRFDGAVTDCHVTLSSDLAYHEPTMRQGLRHALGHCLGLEDDPGIDVTVDLRSIMSSPLDPLGELTPGDRERLRRAVEAL